MLVTTPASDLQRKPASWPFKSQFHWSTGKCWQSVVCSRHQLLSTHFSHGLAIQVELVAAEAKSPSDLGGSPLRVLFHGLDTSRRNAFQSSAEACYRHALQVRGFKRSPCHVAVLHVRTSRLRVMHCQVQTLDHEALSSVAVNLGQSRPVLTGRKR